MAVKGNKVLDLVFLVIISCIGLTLMYKKQNKQFEILDTRHTHVVEEEKEERQPPTSVVLLERELHDLLKENCNIALNQCGVDVNNTILTIDEYKKYYAQKFIQENANPFPKSKTPPKLTNFKGMPTPNPACRLSSEGPVSDEAINKNLQEEKERRLNLGDDDLLSIKEVQEEIENNNFKVPNLVHYIWFNCKKFYLLNYVCVLSVFRYQNPKLILFHTNCEPEGEYWNALKQIVGSRLKIVKRSPPERVWGTPIKVIEHRADVARLQIEMEVGGIYLDTDSAILKQSDDLRTHKMVLPEAVVGALANNIILANRNASFLRRWYSEYQHFHDNRYAKTSDGKEERSLKELAILNTTYGQISRHAIWGDEKPRDITDWIVTCNATQILLDAMK